MEAIHLGVNDMPAVEAAPYVFHDDVFKVLDLLVTGQDERLRSGVAEVLVVSSSARAEQLLVKLLADEADVVRASACESLGTSRSPHVLKLLENKLLRDKSSLVRGYAASSAANIARSIGGHAHELRTVLQRALDKEKVLWVKLHLFRGLYMLGEQSYSSAIHEQLNSRSFRVRSLARQILSDMDADRHSEGA